MGSPGVLWRQPEVEVMNKTFNESSRFYSLFGEARNCGLKYVPPPIHENLQSLIKEQMHFEKKSPNYLLNGRYSRKETGSRFGDRGHNRALTHGADDMKSIASTASGRNSVATPLPGKDRPKLANINGDLPVQLNESQLQLLKKEFGINNNELTAQQKKFLKLAGNKRFSFPKR